MAEEDDDVDVIRAAGTAVAGAAAGALGTLAMDLVWFRRSRAAGDDSSFTEWEATGDVESFEDAGAPAEVGRRAADAVGVEIPPRLAGATTDAMHWTTGLGWGTGAALLTAVSPLGPVTSGLLCGGAAFATAYTVLPALGLYDPIWEYDGKTLWKDGTAHLTFGAGVGAALGLAHALGGRWEAAR